MRGGLVSPQFREWLMMAAMAVSPALQSGRRVGGVGGVVQMVEQVSVG